MSYGFGLGQDSNGPLMSQVDCLQAGRWWIDGQCLSAADFAAKVCAEQVGGAYNPQTHECEMRAQTGLSEAASRAACQAMQGTWNDERKSCAMPLVPPGGAPPGGPPAEPPPARGAVPWGTLAVIGVGLTAAYYVFSKR